MEIGEYIDKYIITEVIHGGMSEVYRVAIEGAPIRFVLKRLKKDANDEQRKLFCREMRILQKLKHLYIIEVLEEHYDGECPYYVMPSCGKSFVDIASSSDDYYKLVLTMQMCEGLEYMHNNGVRHRDIKPQNILIKDDIVKIADFGLSRFWDRDSTTLTATSLAAGTQGYMPPEYSSGGFKEGTVQGDIYMLGKTIYFLFSHGGDVSNIRLNRVSPQIAAIVEKATRENPEDRYASITTIIEELRSYKEAIEAIDKLPKSIKDIKSNYKSGSIEFNEELYKHFCFLSNESMKWGESLSQLGENELMGMLKYKKDYINNLASHFIECISSTSDYIQFGDIDQFVKFGKCVVASNLDIATNQQLISFLIDLSVNYSRWPSMNGLAKILNAAVSSDPEHYRMFIFNHRDKLKEMQPNLNVDSKFNSEICLIIAK